jgi:hypothetical protein
MLIAQLPCEREPRRLVSSSRRSAVDLAQQVERKSRLDVRGVFIGMLSTQLTQYRQGIRVTAGAQQELRAQPLRTQDFERIRRTPSVDEHAARGFDFLQRGVRLAEQRQAARTPCRAYDGSSTGLSGGMAAMACSALRSAALASPSPHTHSRECAAAALAR